jgi:DNA-binding response OmpR family regulator
VATILLLPEGHEIAGSGAEGFLTPPFTSRRLLYQVNKIAKANPRRDIQAGELILEPRTDTLRRGAKAVRVRPKETALLAVLMRNRGKVLSRKELMQKVWETDYPSKYSGPRVGDTRTLDVHICWLRAKIAVVLTAKCLRTIRGVGYRFDVPEPALQATPPGAGSDEGRRP